MLLKIHDRPFKKGSDKLLQNMSVAKFNDMALFTQLLQGSLTKAEGINIPPSSEGGPDSILVRFHPHGASAEQLSSSDALEDVQELTIPLEPDISGLKTAPIDMYTSTTIGYDMGSPFNDWFSSCFGFRVKFIYLGPNSRPVLGNVGLPPTPPETPPSSPTSWLPSLSSLIALTSSLPLVGPWLSPPSPDPSINTPGTSDLPSPSRIGFQDCAALLVVTTESLSSVSARLPNGEAFDITKFRPNIVLSGSPEAWDEDFWGTLRFKSPVLPRPSSQSSQLPNGTTSANDAQDGEAEGLEVILTANCSRCVSINVDYGTGAPGKGEAGTMLKKLMRDRRVDAGRKWSPVFGRYGFLGPSGAGKGPEEWKRVSVGDEVEVTRRLEERDTWCKCCVFFLCHHVISLFGAFLLGEIERGS